MTRYRIRSKASGDWLTPLAFDFMTTAVLHALHQGYTDFEIVSV